MAKEKLKGVHALESIFTEMFEDFGIRKVGLGSYYAYWHKTESITFCPYDSIEDKWFNEFVEERFNDIHLGSSLIIGFLHEIGHHETMDEISDTVQAMCDEEKERIEQAMEETDNEEEVKRLEWQYFNLPDEIMATYWAVDFIRNNLDEVNRMNKIAQKAMESFYRINGITD